MGKWTNKTAGLIFLAAASVYSDQAIVAAAGRRASSPAAAAVVGADASTPDVKLIEETTDPFAGGATTAPAAATNPTTDPAAASQPTATQPSEGRSVSNSEVSVSDAGTVEIH